MEHNWSIQRQTKGLFYGFGAVVVLSIFAFVLTQEYLMLAVPAVLLLFYFTLSDFRKIFFLLLCFLPLSTEVTLPNGFSTDLPSEPLIVGLMGVFFLYVLRYPTAVAAAFFRHPITLLLLLHLGWMLVATVQSSELFVSVKFFLAKIWYVVTFYFLAGLLLKEEKDVRQAFWIIFIPLIFTILIVLARHAQYGFSFEMVYKVLSPFYRNHVTYAAIMAIMVPWVWFARYWYPAWSTRWWVLLGGLLLLLVAVQLSYTRAAYLAIFVAAGAYVMIRLRLTKLTLAGAAVVAFIGLTYLGTDERYLELAPNYERTITHTDFGNLIEATYQLEDISTMERVYRWVAAFQMIGDKPWFGFGPGNFYNFYKGYTVTSFRTYVSDNPEQSGVHSYYLMTLVDQGIPGLIIFLLFLFGALIYGENIYHRTKDVMNRRIVMIALLMIVVISLLQLINDLIETDKVGPFFFISLALLVNVDLQNRRRASIN
ncbi:MAG: O-antigen ligase family protein [Saprospiraceae bacterium]